MKDLTRENLKVIAVSEVFRTYMFEGFEITVENVKRIYISDTGSHRIEDNTGVVWYIPAGWRYFKFKGGVVA